MIYETFVADTPKEAYDEAVKKYGTDIVLISAKQITNEHDILRCEVSIAVPKKIPFVEVDCNDSLEMAEAIVDETEEDVSLLEELDLLKRQLASMREDILAGSKNNTLEKVKTLFSEKGIAKKWLDDATVPLVGSGVLNDEKLLVSYMLEEIDESLEIVKESLDEPKIVMLVGPTGVGKTTTIAKLAARYAYLMDKTYKVAFLNLDSYKVGAFSQLEEYASIMHIEHAIVNSTESFEDALERLKAYDIILVDTAGMSPYDIEKFIKTVEFVKSDMPRKLEVNLLISATIKYEDMSDVYNNFSFLNLHSVIISKFDETKHLGTLLNFMLLHKVPMSYFCNGQEVPDDLLVASKEYLLESFVGDLDS